MHPMHEATQHTGLRIIQVADITWSWRWTIAGIEYPIPAERKSYYSLAETLRAALQYIELEVVDLRHIAYGDSER